MNIFQVKLESLIFIYNHSPEIFHTFLVVCRAIRMPSLTHHNKREDNDSRSGWRKQADTYLTRFPLHSFFFHIWIPPTTGFWLSHSSINKISVNIGGLLCNLFIVQPPIICSHLYSVSRSLWTDDQIIHLHSFCWWKGQMSYPFGKVLK